MSQTPTPTPSNTRSTIDDEFWKKQSEALLGALSLRDLGRRRSASTNPSLAPG